MTASSAGRPPQRRRHRALAVVGVLVAALIVLILIWDWNWFKGPIERQVEAATGREFRIEGDLDVDLSLTAPTLRADGLRLANAEWSEEPEMVRVGRLEVQVAIWRLLRGDIVLPRLDLTEPRVVVETGEDGDNWVFDTDDDSEPGQATLPDLRNLRIVDGQLVFREGQRTDLTLALHTEEPPEPGAAAPLALSGDGSYRGEPFTLEGRIDSPLELIDAEGADAYRLDVRAAAGASRAHVRGTLDGALQLGDFELAATLSGNDLSDLYPLVGLTLPATPPYSLDGRLGRSGDTWTFHGFQGQVGDSDLAGDVSVDVAGERPRLEADVTSSLLDFDDLAGFLNLPPSTGEGETASPEQQAQAAQREASERVLPQEPYDLEALRNMDADVRLRAQRIEAPGLPIDDMDAHLLLEAGVVRLDPLDFGVAGGRVRSVVDMDASRDTIATAAEVQVRDLELSRLFPGSELMQDAVGRIAGHVDLRGSGNSIAAMLADADGELALGMGSGRMSNLLLELVGLDIAESIQYWLGRDPEVIIRCGYVDVGVEDGMVTSRALVFDTDDTVIHGEGWVNLGDESMQLRIAPEPKDFSFLSVRTPLWVTGTLGSPGVAPDAGGLALRGAIAAALGAVVAPPAALLALLEFGPGEDSDCGAAVRAEQE